MGRGGMRGKERGGMEGRGKGGEKSILKIFSVRTRFDDALARISPIYSSEFSLQKPAQSEAFGREWGGDHEVIKR